MESPHPSDQTLRSLGLGRLDGASSASIAEHLDGCSDCRRRASELASVAATARSGQSSSGATTVDGGSSPALESLPPGLADHADYRVVRELGRGGMGVVYLAHNTMMGRDEVLKVMGRNITERPGVLERFQREIRAVAKLRHPNIVAAYTAFRLDGGLVFAMEYIEGLDLHKLVKTKGPLSVAHAAYFIHQAALGLQHAHERGMVHRDIKPHNLMLASEGKARVVKVLDFGLAKASREEKVDGGLTSEGQALGTPDYIAPEQILNAQGADIRADLYSLGGTLYYLLTGRPPFRAKSLYDMYQSHISREADPLDRLRPDVPAELAALASKMMAKDPDLRFQTPGEVAQALTPFFKPRATSSAERPIPVAPRDSAPPPKEKDKGKDWEGSIDVQESGPTRLRPSGGRSGLPAWVWPVVGASTVLAAGLVAWVAVGFRPSGSPPRPAPPPPVGREVVADRPIATGPARDDRGPSTADGARPGSNRVDENRPTPGNPPAPVPTPEVAGPIGSLVIVPSPAPAPAPAPPPAETKVEPEAKVAVPAPAVVDLRHLKARPGELRLQEPGAMSPRGTFWPEFLPNNVAAWRIGDPSAIRMNSKGIVLSAGDGGNFLMSENEKFGRFLLSADIEAFEGTEAYLALRVHREGGAWRAVTSRIVRDGGPTRVGHQALDFATDERGLGPLLEFPANKVISIQFEVVDKGEGRVRLGGKPTSTVDLAGTPAAGWDGSAGVFVKSGRLVLSKLTIMNMNR